MDLSGILSDAAPERRTWEVIVDGVRRSDPQAFNWLYSALGPGLLFFAIRERGGIDAKLTVQRCLEQTITAIQTGELASPDQLVALARNKLKSLMGAAQQPLASIPPPDEPVCPTLAGARLKRLSPLTRDILRRYYVLQESQEKICEDLEISVQCLRLRLSDARAKVGARAVLPKSASPIARPMLRRTA